MIVYGNKQIVKETGQSETLHCAACKRKVLFKIYLSYINSHIWFIFGWVRKKKYLLVCQGCDKTKVCGEDESISIEHVERLIPKNTIPFMHKHGYKFIMIPFSLLVLMMVIVMIAFSLQAPTH